MKVIHGDFVRELRVLNEAVEEAIQRRRTWMDAHMADFAEHPIGTELFDGLTGKRLGVVTAHYRYWGEQGDPRYDTTMDINYRFDNGDNTSRYGGSILPLSREQLARYYERKARAL